MKYNENMEIFNSAKDLPDCWESVIGDNIYMRRDFLLFLETVNPRNQMYYLFYDSRGLPDTVFLTYRDQTFNLALLKKKKILVDMTMIYVPVWVKRPGIVFGKERTRDAIRYIKKIKGCKMLYCIGERNLKSGFVRGAAAPACTLDIHWNSFDAYLSALRSGYRYRYKKALQKSAELSIELLSDNTEFSDELYALYEQVETNAKIKIDKLPLDFFKSNLFKILVFKTPDGKPVGFVQLLENGEELVFEFVGFDYDVNSEYQVYHRMLLEIIRYAIENGFQRVDFGQTADDTKLKLGCRYEYLYAYVHHANPFVMLLYRVLAPLIEYKPLKPGFCVLKTMELKEDDEK